MSDFNDTRKYVNVKGIYCTSNFTVGYKDDTSKKNAINKLASLIERTELNAIVIDIKHEGGSILYDFGDPEISKYGTVWNVIPFLPELIKELHQKGIYVIARVVAFEDPGLAKARPDLALYNKDGSLYKDNKNAAWVSPFYQDCWKYLADIGKACAKVGFDEVNYDYIRFPTDKVTNLSYNNLENVIGKATAVTAGVRYLCEQLKPLGIYVSADVYGIVIKGGANTKSTGQDYVAMSRYLDYICPMIYPSHYDKSWTALFGETGHPDKYPYEMINLALKGSVQALSVIAASEHCAEVRPWLQDFTADYLGKNNYIPYDAVAVRKEILATYNQGYKGWFLWNARGTFTEGALLTPEQEAQGLTVPPGVNINLTPTPVPATPTPTPAPATPTPTPEPATPTPTQAPADPTPTTEPASPSPEPTPTTEPASPSPEPTPTTEPASPSPEPTGDPAQGPTPGENSSGSGQ